MCIYIYIYIYIYTHDYIIIIYIYIYIYTPMYYHYNCGCPQEWRPVQSPAQPSDDESDPPALAHVPEHAGGAAHT